MSRKNPRFHRTNSPLPAPTTNIFELIVRGSIEGQITINTFYFADQNATGTFVGSPEADINAGFLAILAPTYRACISADWSLTSVKTQCLTTPSRAPVTSTAGLPLAGTGAAGHEPTEVAAVCLRFSGLKGQSGRGRFSLPAVPTGAVLSSNLTAAGLAANQAFCNAYNANFVQNAHTYTPMLVSRRGISPNFSYGTAVLVTCTATSLLGTIRRRKIGRGR